MINNLLSIYQKILLVCAAMLTVCNLNAQTHASSSKAPLPEMYTVTPVPPENGSYSIEPKIPEDGKVQAGTVDH